MFKLEKKDIISIRAESFTPSYYSHIESQCIVAATVKTEHVICLLEACNHLHYCYLILLGF